MLNYLGELDKRKARVVASKSQAERSIREALVALKKADSDFGVAHDDIRSLVGLGRKMQSELKKVGKHMQFQGRVDRLMPKVKTDLQVCERGRAAVLKALADLQSVFSQPRK
jgi:translation initiation factor IF-3